MEKENKRLRDEGIRDFNDAVRVLVSFVKKRDPRLAPHRQTEEQRLQAQREQTAAHAARARAANRAKIKAEVLPEWSRFTHVRGEEDEEELSDDRVKEEVECVVCRKVFKSENQYQAHEKSKKHLKTIFQLKKRMRLEDDSLDLEHDALVERNDHKDAEDNLKYTCDQNHNPDPEIVPSPSLPETLVERRSDSSPVAALSTSDEAPETDDEYAPREVIEERLSKPSAFNSEPDGVATVGGSSNLEHSEILYQEPKLGKAKAKRLKKAAAVAKAQEDSELQTAVCIPADDGAQIIFQS